MYTVYKPFDFITIKIYKEHFKHHLRTCSGTCSGGALVELSEELPLVLRLGGPGIALDGRRR